MEQLFSLTIRDTKCRQCGGGMAPGAVRITSPADEGSGACHWHPRCLASGRLAPEAVKGWGALTPAQQQEVRTGDPLAQYSIYAARKAAEAAAKAAAAAARKAAEAAAAARKEAKAAKKRAAAEDAAWEAAAGAAADALEGAAEGGGGGRGKKRARKG